MTIKDFTFILLCFDEKEDARQVLIEDEKIKAMLNTGFFNEVRVLNQVIEGITYKNVENGNTD